jgi:regulation of enolase protein 1 (concanavalin A-like superfamily)
MTVSAVSRIRFCLPKLTFISGQMPSMPSLVGLLSPRRDIETRKGLSMRFSTYVLALSACIMPISSQAQAQAALPKLAGLPAPPMWQNATSDWSTDKSGTFILAAGKKTDWFVWPGAGDYRSDASPRLLFNTDENFSFSTRVDVVAHAIYDAGCIALSGTASRWAKFCLEAQAGGSLAIVAVVTRDFSDDATSYPVTGTSTYLKVAKDQRGIFFYASGDGRRWTIVRKFNLDAPDGLRAGFSVQSPEGEGARAVFSDFHYSTGKIDLWRLQ